MMWCEDGLELIANFDDALSEDSNPLASWRRNWRKLLPMFVWNRVRTWSLDGIWGAGVVSFWRIGILAVALSTLRVEPAGMSSADEGSIALPCGPPKPRYRRILDSVFQRLLGFIRTDFAFVVVVTYPLVVAVRTLRWASVVESGLQSISMDETSRAAREVVFSNMDIATLRTLAGVIEHFLRTAVFLVSYFPVVTLIMADRPPSFYRRIIYRRCLVILTAFFCVMAASRLHTLTLAVSQDHGISFDIPAKTSPSNLEEPDPLRLAKFSVNMGWISTFTFIKEQTGRSWLTLVIIALVVPVGWAFVVKKALEQNDREDWDAARFHFRQNWQGLTLRYQVILYLILLTVTFLVGYVATIVHAAWYWPLFHLAVDMLKEIWKVPKERSYSFVFALPSIFDVEQVFMLVVGVIWTIRSVFKTVKS